MNNPKDPPIRRKAKRVKKTKPVDGPMVITNRKTLVATMVTNYCRGAR